jgi:hypothetical protein
VKRIRLMPRSSARLVDGDARIVEPWHSYLAGIEEQSRRVAGAQADLTGTPSAVELRDAINNLFEALRLAGLMER